MGTMAPAARPPAKSSGGFKSDSGSNASSSGRTSVGSNASSDGGGNKAAVEVTIRDDQNQKSCCSVM